MSVRFQLNYQLNTDPDNYLFEFHPEEPTFNYHRREFRRFRNANKPPGAETEEGESGDDSTPEPYEAPSTSPSPPSSAATMDLETMDMHRDPDETPVHTPRRARSLELEPAVNPLFMDTPSERYRQNPHYPHVTLNTPAPPTPHAMAARRALEDRRMAMFTPGRARRQSFREQRETPMLVLRNLGRALAPTSKAIDSSSSPEKPSPANGAGSARGAARRNGDDDDDELPIDRPRLSLPIDQGSSDDLQPPHSSMLDDANNTTVQSVELPRRATTGEAPHRHRRSFPYLRDSDVPSWDDTTADPFAYPPGIAPHQPSDPEIADLRYPPGLGPESDFSLDMPEGLSDDEHTTTFIMRPPAVNNARAPSPSSDGDDVSLMERPQPEMDMVPEQPFEQPSVQQGGQPSGQPFEQSSVQQGGQPPEQPFGQPSVQPSVPDDVTPPLGDFEHVGDIGDAEMNALLNIDPALFGQDPEDEWIGYHPGRPRKRRREEREASARAEAEAESQAQAQAEAHALAHAQAQAQARAQAQQAQQAQARARAQAQAQAQVRTSAHNIQYAPMTTPFVRQAVQTAAQTSSMAQQRLAGDALETFTRATEWFFRQLGDDARAFAGHASRGTVEERDLVAMMHRQRIITAQQTLLHLANQHLPRELQQLLRSSNPGYQPAYPVAQQAGIHVQQPPQQSPQQPLYTQQPVQQPLYAQRPVQQPVQQPLYAQQPAQRATQQPLYAQRPGQQPAQRPIQRPGQRPVQQPAQQTHYTQHPLYGQQPVHLSHIERQLPFYAQQYLRAQQPLYPQQPLANAQAETVAGVGSVAPNPPDHAGSKRKRDEGDDGESEAESLVYPEDDDWEEEAGDE